MASMAESVASASVMSGADSTGSQQQTWRERAFVSELPSDFLCPEGEAPAENGGGGGGAGGTRQQQEEQDRQAALALQRYYSTRQHAPALQTAIGRLNLTIAQAKLTKNYGLTRMDPYVRLRLGHCVYETQTCYNGATNPRWNKAVMCYVPNGVTALRLEVYDECSFTDDQLIAHATVQIPEVVISGGETSDDWHPLSGKQGDGKEGMINLIMNYTPLSAQEMSVPAPGTLPVLMPQSFVGIMPTMGVPVYTQQAQPQPQPQQQQQPPPARPQPPPIQPEDVAQLKEMFPAMDVEIIRSVLETRGGDKAAAISSLLELTET